MRGSLKSTGIAAAALAMITSVCAGSANAGTVTAHVPIGAKYYSHSSSAATDITVFSSVQNTIGIDLRTVVVGCTAVAFVYALGPSNQQRLIGECAPPPNGGTAMQMSGLYLPVGWGLLVTTNGPTSVYITYDEP